MSILENSILSEERWVYDRLRYNLSEILDELVGNVVEIGAGEGTSTKVLCKVAKSYGREVLVIDPFEKSWDDIPKGYRYSLGKFEADLKGQDYTLHQESSRHESTPEMLKEFMPIAFAYVDGLQDYDNILQDLYMLADVQTAVICVDDIDAERTEAQVLKAVKTFTKNRGYELIEVDRNNKEGYLIRTT